LYGDVGITLLRLYFSVMQFLCLYFVCIFC